MEERSGEKEPYLEEQQQHWLLGHSLLMGDLGVGHTNDAGGRREHSMWAGEE